MEKEQRARDHLEMAKQYLAEKDLLCFIEQIAMASVLSQEDQALYAETTYLKSKGLMLFNEHRRALTSIKEALEYNDGVARLRLMKYQGIALGYLGHLQTAKKQFLELLRETDDLVLQVELYNNLVWAFLLLCRPEVKDEYLREAQGYLQLVGERFEMLTDYQKRVYFYNAGDYYSLKQDYENAIGQIEKALPYCRENDLPEAYNNLADLYLKVDEIGVANKVNEYTEQAELMAFKFHNDLEIGKALSTKAMAELREEMYLKAIDGLYVAFEHFKKAEAFAYALECIVKINQIANDFKVECMESLTSSLKGQLDEMSNFNHL